jgi:acetyltransferase-like isoleucine patch superfamily enzyme
VARLKAVVIKYDPITWLSRLRVALHTRRVRSLYPFYAFGSGNSIHFSCQLDPACARAISFGSGVYVAQDCWLNVVAPVAKPAPSIVVGDGCKIGRRTTISSRNLIKVEEDVLFAPDVLLMDHGHAYSDVSLPIHAQGLTGNGTIIVERNCWLGYGAAVLSGEGELRIGRNSVVGAHAIVRDSIPPYSVAVGSPARVVKQFNSRTGEWMRIDSISKK